MSCSTFTLPSVKAGETWDGITGSLSSDGTTFSEDLASLRMIFSLDGAVVLTLTSAASQITFTGWESFTVAAVTAFIATAGNYSWIIETTNTAGRVKTYHSGTIEVTA